MDSQVRVELEHQRIALQAQEQLQLDRMKESKMAIQFELTSELKEKHEMLDASKKKSLEHGALAQDMFNQSAD
eukprot:6580311-Prorocentrum_lima.AAC.1